MSRAAVRVAWGVACVVAVLAGTPETAWAQSASADAVRLRMGVSSGMPDAEPEVALRLEAPPGRAIGRIEAVIAFPDEGLAFQRAFPQPLLRDAVDVSASVRAGPDGGRALALTVTARAADTALAAGVLANLVFRIARNARPGLHALALEAKAFAPDGRQVGRVELTDGAINVLVPSVGVCFMYMH